jgi:hypothetical protein
VTATRPRIAMAARNAHAGHRSIFSLMKFDVTGPAHAAVRQTRVDE